MPCGSISAPLLNPRIRNPFPVPPMWRTLAHRVSSSVVASPPPPLPPLLPSLRRAFSAVALPYSSTSSCSSTDAEDLPDDQLLKRLPPSHANHFQTSGMSPYTYNTLKRRQIKVETEEWERATRECRELFEAMCAQRLAPHLPFTKSLFMGWFEPLRDRIAEEQRLIEKDGRGKCKGKQHHAEALEQLSADKIAVVTMHTVMAMLMRGGSSGGGAHYLRAALEVGEAVEHEARIERLLGKKRKNTSKDRTSKYPQECEADSLTNDERVANKVSKLLKNQKMDKQEIKDDPGTNKKNIAKEVVKLMKNKRISEVKKIAKKLDDTELGGDETRARVGSKLIEMLVDTAYIQQPVSQSGDQSFDLRPAFHHRLRRILSGKVHVSCGFIECDPLVHQGLEKTARHMVVPYMPMLVPPLDWIGYNKGAYFFLPSYLMRIHGSKHQRHAIRTASRQQMQICYEALNTLGSIKWRINKRILGIVDRIWSSGGCLAGLVDREDVPLPEKPDTEDEAVIKKWRWDRRLARKENMERYSQRCDVELKLNVARKLKDEEGFYYPHNLDFRGRAYPMHPYMNHLGSDLCRGVLEFAEGRPLGKSGLHWLKIQLANVYAGGVDKLPLEGRVAFADSHIEDIFDSADRPLEGGRWWLDAEDPFQCLAVCINLAEALRTPSPESAISHLPVHQDGSCNGLQHYAALGRDKVGAAAVNLIAGEKPADVYTEISKRVLQNVQSDAEKDPAIDECAKFARFLIDQVDRKLVKQTVMTSVYGVTFIGAKEQVRKRLRERGLEDDALLFASSTYAARLILTTLGEMFVSARQIMTWLGDCAKIISMENKPVKWVSRVGLPIVQPYLKKESKEIKTSFQIFSVPQATDEVLARRQRTAFPPNFVHSLDGSHMMMTAIACKKAGLNFAGVHDSFWTHACDVDTMNRILREKFVELYEAPVLENQLENFRKEFPLLEFPPLPPRGDLDIRDVLSSTYFFN